MYIKTVDITFEHLTRAVLSFLECILSIISPSTHFANLLDNETEFLSMFECELTGVGTGGDGWFVLLCLAILEKEGIQGTNNDHHGPTPGRRIPKSGRFRSKYLGTFPSKYLGTF